MDNPVYIALSRQLTLFRDMNVTANNIANANTGGFTAEHILFNSFLVKDIHQGERNKMAFAHNLATFRDTENGPLRITSNPLDLAIQGDGYFSVETPLGVRYTRAGSFQLDGTGALTTSEGYRVLDASGQQITFPEDTTSIEIGEIGNIKVNGEDFATIGIVQFENPRLLERLNGTLLKTEAEAQPAQGVRVAQGMLEGSNVKPVLELTHMIDVSRAVGNSAQFIAVLYDLQRKTADTWTKQQG